MSWKSELDFLRAHCDAREAPLLPPAVCKWFDFNREAPPEIDYDTFMAEIASAPKVLDDWQMHTDAYGWKLLLQPYQRGGRRFYLLMVERSTKPSERDEKNLDRMIRHLGGDPEAHYLLSTRGPNDPDVQDLFTWSAGVATDVVEN